MIRAMRADQRGLSLVELLVAMSITGLLFGAVVGFVMTSLNTFSKDAIRSEMLSQAQTALEIAERDIRLSASAETANSVADPNPPVVSNPYSWQANANTLILATAVEDTAGNIIFADPGRYITEKNNLVYFVRDRTLYKRILADSVSGNTARTSCPQAVETTACPRDRALLQNVRSFDVKYYDNINSQVTAPEARSVELTVALERTASGDPVNVTYTTRTVFRNE